MILFHDVDGCLNDTPGSLLAYSQAMLTETEGLALRALGAALQAAPIDHLVLNTGRCWPDSQHLMRAMEAPKARLLLAEHGALLFDHVDSQCIDLASAAEHGGRLDLAAKVRTAAEIGEVIRWFREVGMAQLCAELEYAGTLLPLPNKEANLTFEVPEEVDGDRALAILKQRIAENFPSLNPVYHWGLPDRFIDVMAEVDKGTGVQLVCSMLGVDPGTTAAVGNGLNDLPMLEAVGMPLCPSDSLPEVREYCARYGQVLDAPGIHGTIGWLQNLT